jgi:hypothetical protein
MTVLCRNKLHTLYRASDRSKGLLWRGRDLYLTGLKRATTGYIILVDAVYIIRSEATSWKPNNSQEENIKHTKIC